MSSAAAATPVNGPDVNRPMANSPSSNPPGPRAQLKMPASAKGPDAARKQSASPVDGTQRKPPAQKAWSQGTNPITQRSTNLNNSNGVANALKTAQNQSAAPSDSAMPMKHLNDRMMFLLAKMTGSLTNITLKNGDKYTGVLSGTSMDPTEMRYVFRMVKKIQAAGNARVNGASDAVDHYVGHGEDHVQSFDIGDVADLHASGIVTDSGPSKAQNGTSAGFRTDADISGNLAARERTLQRWEPSAGPNTDMSLEHSGRSSEWDQFSTNEQLFGVRSDYDENMYTTTIDRSNPQYAERAARAEKIARDIESSNAMNSHVREERGIMSHDDKGLDEEEKYSGVRRNDFTPLSSGQTNRYTPPARRPPTAQPTVPGAPVDPAIISSQLARPDAAPARATEPSVPSLMEKLSAADSTRAGVNSKDTPANTDTKTAVTAKAVTADSAQKPSTALKPAVSGAQARKPNRPDNATANVEHDLLESFKSFSAAEKLRLSERQRSLARESKAVKLNDLKKFSQNFKLNTPVPSDLVPILAKDETKQQLIVEKALRASQEKVPSPQAVPASDSKAASRASTAKMEPSHQASPTTVERQHMHQNQRPRPAANQFGATSLRERNVPAQNLNQVPRGTGLLGPRLALNQQQHKQQGGVPYNGIPHPIPDMRIPPPSGPSNNSSGAQTPLSAASNKFNARAHEFRPNPAANTFQPGGDPNADPSPRPDSSSRPDPSPRKLRVTSFFGGQRPTMKPLDLNESFNPVKRLAKEGREDTTKSREYANNGGVPFPFRTPPTWDFPETNRERGYKDMFERNSASLPVSAPHGLGNGPIPHQHQLPLHLQGSQSHSHAPHHTPRHPHSQPHHAQGGPHPFEGHSMQFSHSTPSVQPSPRTMPNFIYNAQPQQIPGYPQQVPMQSFGMSPSVQHVGLRQGGPQFVNGPVPGMGGQMMTNQPSSGPFMGMPTNPQMQMYSPAQGPAYPHYPTQMAGPPGPNGYPSPRPGAPMMHHQGSQQGHQPQHVVYMPQNGQGPPMFAQMPPGSMTPMRQQPYPQPHQSQHYSPHQHHQFPQQAHRGTPSGSYSQPMAPQHSVPPQGPASHAPEAIDDVK